MNNTDLLIVGAGLAGLPAALACAANGWQVTIVDQSSAAEPLPEDPMDQRCTAIGSASEALLRSWGMWDTLSSDAQSIQQVNVTQRGFLGSVRLSAEELGVAALGHVIENRCWVQMLRQHITTNPLITLYPSTEVRSIDASLSDSLAVGLSSNDTINTKLLIAADGVNSSVRALCGIETIRTDYEQSALMTTVRLSEPHHGCAFERFTSTGPLAFLPRPGNIMSLVWCLSPQEAATMASAPSEAIIDALQTQFGYRLGRINAIGPCGVVPLIRHEAKTQTSDRVVLLGNAARLLHPVAGQGFNLALRDLASLLDAIGYRTEGCFADPGSADVLQRFTQMRQRDQRKVVALTDTLARSFRGEARLPAHVRGLALMGLDSSRLLRTSFAMQSMGYTG